MNIFNALSDGVPNESDYIVLVRGYYTSKKKREMILTMFLSHGNAFQSCFISILFSRSTWLRFKFNLFLWLRRPGK